MFKIQCFSETVDCGKVHCLDGRNEISSSKFLPPDGSICPKGGTTGFCLNGECKVKKLLFIISKPLNTSSILIGGVNLLKDTALFNFLHTRFNVKVQSENGEKIIIKDSLFLFLSFFLSFFLFSFSFFLSNQVTLFISLESQNNSNFQFWLPLFS